MDESLFAGGLFLAGIIVSVLGFAANRFFHGNDKHVEKQDRIEEKNETEIFSMKLTMERMTTILESMRNEMKQISEDAKLASTMFKTVKELQEDIIKNKASTEAAWLAIEELRYESRKNEGTLTLARQRKPRAAKPK